MPLNAPGVFVVLSGGVFMTRLLYSASAGCSQS